MGKQSIDTLKSWFQTGDKPTQQQFYDWLDSFIHKDDGIDIVDIEGLVNILNAKADNNAITAFRSLVQPYRLQLNGDSAILPPPGFLYWKMIVTSEENAYLAIETEYNTGNVLPVREDPLFAQTPYTVTCDIVVKPEPAEPVSIFFRNVTGPTEVLLYRLFLTPFN